MLGMSVENYFADRQKFQKIEDQLHLHHLPKPKMRTQSDR